MSDKLEEWRSMKRQHLAFCSLIAAGCGGPEAQPAAPEPAPPAPVRLASEVRLSNLRQLTFGGENAEAYWSFDGRHLVFQAHSGEGCDQIYRMPVDDPSRISRVSNGEGATTCAYFLPGDQEVVYASTHLGGPACPPKPDRSQGYVWALYPEYDIFRARLDGSGVVRLTETPGYDAEATTCARDGSIVFTSVRDGDLELYRMNADGTGVVRLTHTPGYDGGAFFNADCSRIVWRASRPEGAAREEYQRLLSQGLVRPSRLELFVAAADGSDPVQITALGAAAFAPFWHPSGRRILFSSNHGDPRGREFDLWAVDVDGTHLERITFTPGFDGFPMFSPDGRWLAFASNRATAPGSHDTNVFLAEWNEAASGRVVSSGADRILADVEWLADEAREGRGLGTRGLEAAGEYIERAFGQIGLVPAGDEGTFRAPFEVSRKVSVLPATRLELGARALSASEFQPLAFSASGQIKGELLLVDYGIVAPDLDIDDYAGRNVRGKIAVVRRFVPDTPTFADPKLARRYGDLWTKAIVAKKAGAQALVVVDAPLPPAGAGADFKAPDEARFPVLTRDQYGDAGLPVVMVGRRAFAESLRALERKKRVSAALEVSLGFELEKVFNVVGRLPASVPKAEQRAGAIVVGAHYDHLGYGGHGSLAPDSTAPHLGADDNASGVAAMLEIARQLAKDERRYREVVFIAFSAEESGVLGSSHLVSSPPTGLQSSSYYAMLNLDMVGRLRDNRLTVLGVKTATEWEALTRGACERQRVSCALSGDGYGPSDQTSFYAAGVPVLHFFSGPHQDYHKPSDTPDRINALGAQQVSRIVADLVNELDAKEVPLGYQRVVAEPARGDARSFNASLGTIPDYAGPKDGKGVLLAGVRPGSAAEKAGLRRGDVLLGLGRTPIVTLHDFMFVLNESRPGQTVTARALRDGKPIEVEVTFTERSGGSR